MSPYWELGLDDEYHPVTIGRRQQRSRSNPVRGWPAYLDSLEPVPAQGFLNDRQVMVVKAINGLPFALVGEWAQEKKTPVGFCNVYFGPHRGFKDVPRESLRLVSK